MSNPDVVASNPDPQPPPSAPPARRWRTWLTWALIPAAFALGIGAGYVMWAEDAASWVALQEQEGQPPRFEVAVEGHPSLGPEDAPITIVEFSDYNCGFCRRFHQETFPALLAAFPDQVRFVYRDFPVTSQESFYAAQAARCAGAQGDYWGFHDLLFEGGLTLGPEAYRAYAGQMGLDSEALMACVESGEFADSVEQDARFAAGLGVSGTPTFFINGIPMVGAQPLAQFQSVINFELDG
jgi:protein-disulfide isomerase